MSETNLSCFLFLGISLVLVRPHFRSVFTKSVISWDSRPKQHSIVFAVNKHPKTGVNNPVDGGSSLVELSYSVSFSFAVFLYSRHILILVIFWENLLVFFWLF